MITTILVPFDGSEHSGKALDLACDLSEKYAAALHVIHVAQPPGGDYRLVLGGGSSAVKSLVDELATAAHRTMQDARDIASKHGCLIQGEEVLSGDPTEQILDYAKEHGVDMIVMGSRGLSQLKGLMVGSVSSKVAHLASCTCVSVR